MTSGQIGNSGGIGMGESLEERVARLEGITEQINERLGHIEVELSDLRNAIKSETDMLRGEMNGLRGEMNTLRGEMSALRTEMREEISSIHARMDEMRAEMMGKIESQGDELREEIGRLRSDVHRNFRFLVTIIISVLFPMWVTIILSILLKR
jgi:chromosome segregation ATPase